MIPSGTSPNRPAVKRKPLLRHRRIFLGLFAIQILLSIVYFRYQELWGKKKVRINKTFPILQHPAHFHKSVGPYSSVLLSNRKLASRNYSSNLREKDAVILKFFITDYIAFHKANRKHGRRLVFTQAGGGLGDRFQGMFYAYWVAVMTRRIFLVDWNQPFPLDDFLQGAENGLDLFYDREKDRIPLLRHQNGTKVPDMSFVTGKTTVQKEFEAIIQSRTHTVRMESSRLWNRFTKRFYEDHKAAGISARQLMEAFGSINFKRMFLHHVFRIKDSVRVRHEEMSRSMGIRAYGEWKKKRRGRPYIAVHARLGKGVGEISQRFEDIMEELKTPAMCLATRAILLSLNSGSPPLPVFLATDTNEFREVFSESVRRMSHNRVRVASGDWNAVHTKDVVVSLQHLLESRNNTQREGIESARTALWESYADLLMLGQAEHIVALYSSFPRLAFALGDAESLTELRNELCLEEQRQTLKNVQV